MNHAGLQRAQTTDIGDSPCERSSSPAPPASSESNFVRLLLNRGEAVKLVAFDKLTYAGNLANLQDLLDEAPEQARLRQGRHLRPRRRRQRVRRARRHARSSTSPPRATSIDHPRLRAVRADECRRHAGAARRRQGEGRRRSSCRSAPTRSTARCPEDKPEIKFTEETPLAAQQPVQRQQGRRATAWCGRTSTRSTCRC